MESSEIVTGAHDGGGGSLLERDVALGAMMDAMGTVERGGGAVLLLEGAAGIGKTSLMQAGRSAARKAGFRVGSAVGSPMESGLPFGLMGQALVELGGSDVVDVVELQRLGDPSARLYRMFQWLVNAAAAAPLLLALDDLHWADPDSLGLLGFLARRVSDSRILVLGAMRPEPDGASAVASELLGCGQARVLALQPLSREASVAFVQRSVPRVLDAAEGEGVWRACAGTPLLLKEAAWTLAGGGSLPTAPGEDGLGASLLLERFAGVDGDSFAFVLAASILGVRFRPSLAGALAGLDGAQAQAAHARLVRARLLEDLGGGGAAFVHPLFAQALLESQPPSERERRHGEAFRLLLDRGEEDAMAAEHAVAARLLGDPLAVEVCARAGRAALAQGALQATSVHLGNAVELAGEAAGDDLLLGYASALGARGRVEAVDRVCGRLLARGDLDPAVRARVLALLARIAMMTGRPAEAEGLYEEAAAAAMLADPATEAAILADAADTCHIVSPTPWVLKMISRALAILPADVPSRRPLELLQAYTLLIGGDPSGADLLAGEASSWGDRNDYGWAMGRAVQTLNASKLLEDFAGAPELFEREFERAVQSGAPLVIIALAMAYADTTYRLGRSQEALELVQQALALSDSPIVPWTDLALAVLLTELGRDEDAAPHVEALRSFLTAMPLQYYAPVSLRLDLLDACRLLGSGEPEQASEKMLHAAQIAELAGWREPSIVPWAGVGIEAHLAAGRIDRARVLMGDLEELTQRLSCRWPRAILELGRARLAAIDGRTEEADRRFEVALEIFAELPLPIAHAEALLAHGSYLRRSGRPLKAREPIARALELCECAGAERVARLARAELAAAGGRRRRRDHDPHELTAQEQRVAAHAAEGMTNAQIAAALSLSSKTVSHHLQHIYAKLEIHSRRELIRRARPPD
jgi:DNA-binding CsgD family transcriptional regulator/tetratricopeptide (TPR) repeat protein